LIEITFVLTLNVKSITDQRDPLIFMSKSNMEVETKLIVRK